MDNKLLISVDTSTANTRPPFESFAATIVAADIMKRCAICEEYTSMNSHDYRAQGVFICDKCKAAVMYIRKTLEELE